jgi:hypothetical protein
MILRKLNFETLIYLAPFNLSVTLVCRVPKRLMTTDLSKKNRSLAIYKKYSVIVYRVDCRNFGNTAFTFFFDYHISDSFLLFVGIDLCHMKKMGNEK